MVPLFCIRYGDLWGFPSGSVVKNAPVNAGDTGDMCSILGLGRFPGEGNGNWLQYSCLRNPVDRGAWWVTAHESDIMQQLSTHTMVICEQWSSVLLTLINIILWLYWGFTNCHSIRWIAKSINNEVSVLTALPTSFPPISHPLLGLLFSLKYSNMEILTICIVYILTICIVNISNNDRKYVRKKIKTNKKYKRKIELEITKVSEEDMSEVETVWNLGLLW